jgi:hypothetical protein
VRLHRIVGGRMAAPLFPAFYTIFQNQHLRATPRLYTAFFGSERSAAR